MLFETICRTINEFDEICELTSLIILLLGLKLVAYIFVILKLFSS